MRFNGKRQTWPDVRNRHPKLGLAIDSAERLLLVGGLGDPSSQLGRIDIYDGDGRLLRALSLREFIHDLEDLSRMFSKFSNFPWVSTIGYLDESGEVIVGVCEKIWAPLKISNLEVAVTDTIDSAIEGSPYALGYSGTPRLGEPRQPALGMSVMVSTSR
ncbi:MAG TPA: hypothetical protein VJ932_06455 [Alkalispirochaeta sp.]|nr:hypothetical protein [Alkalispirochaeta sp.]